MQTCINQLHQNETCIYLNGDDISMYIKSTHDDMCRSVCNINEINRMRGLDETSDVAYLASV
jgi:hypothetical protein